MVIGVNTAWSEAVATMRSGKDEPLDRPREALRGCQSSRRTEQARGRYP
jgi:hypothetical protein